MRVLGFFLNVYSEVPLVAEEIDPYEQINRFHAVLNILLFYPL